MKALKMIDTKQISVDVQVGVKISQLMDKGYVRTESNQVKQNMVFLLNLYDVKYKVEYRLGYFFFKTI